MAREGEVVMFRGLTLLLVCILSSLSYAETQTNSSFFWPNDRAITTAYHLACGASDGGLECWHPALLYYIGDYVESTPYPEFPKNLKNFQDISVSDVDICYLDDGSYYCVDRYSHENENMLPSLANISSISTWSRHVCVVDSGKLSCYRNVVDLEPHEMPADWKNVREVAMGVGQICMLNDSGLHCLYEFENQPTFKNPRQIDLYENVGCGIDENSVKCWNWTVSYAGTKYQLVIPEEGVALKNPSQVSVGVDRLCVIDENQVKCWSSYQDLSGERRLQPALYNPTQISVGAYYTCAVDAEGVKCWGDAVNQPTSVPTSLLHPLFHIGRLLGFLEDVKNTSSPAREKYFSLINEFVRQNITTSPEGDSAAMVLMQSVNQAIKGMDSKHFQGVLIPKLESITQEMQLSFYSKYEKISDNPLNRKVALKSTQAALMVAEEFVDFQERKQVQEVLRQIGQVQSAPMDDQKVSDLIKQIHLLDPIYKKLETPKSKFLIEVISQSTTWLSSVGENHAP